MGSVEERNKDVIYRLFEGLKTMDRSAFDACYANPIVIHTQHEDGTVSHDEHLGFRGEKHFRSDGVIVEATQIHDTYEQYLQLGLNQPVWNLTTPGRVGGSY